MHIRETSVTVAGSGAETTRAANDDVRGIQFQDYSLHVGIERTTLRHDDGEDVQLPFSGAETETMRTTCMHACMQSYVVAHVVMLTSTKDGAT